MKPQEAYLSLLIYFVLISLYAIFATVYDKWCARRRKRRVSEIALLITGMIGGSFAMYIAMRIIHHKTHKLRFMAGLPLIFLAQLLMLLMAAYYIKMKKGALFF